jgi:hypothetical protein
MSELSDDEELVGNSVAGDCCRVLFGWVLPGYGREVSDG